MRRLHLQRPSPTSALLMAALVAWSVKLVLVDFADGDFSGVYFLVLTVVCSLSLLLSRGSER